MPKEPKKPPKAVKALIAKAEANKASKRAKDPTIKARQRQSVLRGLFRRGK